MNFIYPKVFQQGFIYKMTITRLEGATLIWSIKKKHKGFYVWQNNYRLKKALVFQLLEFKIEQDGSAIIHHSDKIQNQAFGVYIKILPFDERFSGPVGFFIENFDYIEIVEAII